MKILAAGHREFGVELAKFNTSGGREVAGCLEQLRLLDAMISVACCLSALANVKVNRAIESDTTKTTAIANNGSLALWRPALGSPEKVSRALRNIRARCLHACVCVFVDRQ